MHTSHSLFRHLRRGAGGLAAALALAAGPAVAVETLPAYNSYQAVPFVVEGGGLGADLVAYLNEKLKGKYAFQITNLSRDKLNQTLDKDAAFKGIVLFLNPLFVDDKDKKKYHWTPGLMNDANAVVSLNSKKIEYVDTDSLKGLKFAGVLGNKYAGFEDRFGKDIQRENANEELSNLRKVASGKADVTIMPMSTYRYLLKQLGEQSPVRTTLYLSSKPHARFERYIFSASGDTALAGELDAVVGAMRADPAWKRVAAKYGLD
ncbi:substrate-binding periplasmic protein [Rugamonas rubra]|uniref:Extracellular solute-binding protein, family 3 n=1 Tax=Rugamonas rubra TaxID=758825 RepID=A0A1I4TXM1_9BURK|nr:transporter substrate-binding domain-containing protein [Rugamonas rubra]SFM81514.1 extracellular solute-binding protein, family 3 [Rugamonas rubra]